MSYLVAQKLTAMYGIVIDCRYLEGSRIAWRMAEYHMLSDAQILDKICIGGVHVTLRKILLRGGLDTAEIETCANDLGLAQQLDESLSYSQAVGYKQTLIKNKRLFKYIRQHSMDAYDMAHAYFEQEGLLDTDKVCIVDSGWVGSMQQTLERIIDRDVEGYYFGLYELPDGVDEKDYHTFYFAPYKDIDKKVLFSNCLFESIFSAGDGMTCGYEIRDGMVVPVKETTNNLNRHRIVDNVNTLKGLIDDVEYIDKVLHTNQDRYLKRMQRLMSNPTKDEADCIGDYLFSDDVNQSSTQELAQPMTVAEIHNTHAWRRMMIMNGYMSRILKDSAWLEGSIVRCDKNVKYHLWHCRIYKRLIYLRKFLKA